MRRFLTVVGFAVAPVVFVAAPAWAQAEPILEIPLGTVVRGAPGSEHLLATVPVAPEDVGQECGAVVVGANNSSVHPNTDLFLRSGGSEVTALDVEREPGAVTETAGTLVLGTDVSISVRLGADGVFSGGGLTVTLDCPPEPTTTTTEAPTTTTTVPVETTAESSTTVAPSTTTTVVVTPSATLPKTGSGTGTLLVAAGAVLLVGAGALLGSAKLRRRGQV